MARTKAAEHITEQAPAEEPVKYAIAELNPPRIPYHQDITDRFGVDRGGWRVLCDSVFPSAKSFDAIVMALSYCLARKLDVFKKPVHIVPMWSSAAGGMIETVWPSINEQRTTAFRTGQYAGMEEPEFGPMIERTFTGTATRGAGKGKQRTVALKFPEWCRVTIIRTLNGKERRFFGPKVYWVEAYAKWADTDVPNDMWCNRTVGQLEKCAEAASLRRAFPEEIGNDPTAEEMEGQRLMDPSAPITPAKQDSAPPEPVPAIEHKPTEVVDPHASWLRELSDSFEGCEGAVELGEEQDKRMNPMRGQVPAEVWKQAEDLLAEHFQRVAGPTEPEEAADETPPEPKLL